MTKIKLIVGWSREAATLLEESGLVGLIKSKIQKGGEWDEYKFETRGEANAFIKAINLSNGWDCPSVKESKF